AAVLVLEAVVGLGLVGAAVDGVGDAVVVAVGLRLAALVGAGERVVGGGRARARRRGRRRGDGRRRLRLRARQVHRLGRRLARGLGARGLDGARGVARLV